MCRDSLVKKILTGLVVLASSLKASVAKGWYMDLAGLSQDICQEYMAAHLEVLKISGYTEIQCRQIMRDFQQVCLPISQYDSFVIDGLQEVAATNGLDQILPHQGATRRHS